MSIKKIEMINFRNHEDIVFNFSPGINIIWGENGSGKTSIIEAVHILSNGKSFKTNRLVETITTKKQETIIKAGFGDKEIVFHQTTKPSKRIKINKIEKTTKDLVGQNPTVLISPEEEKITKGPHSERRKFFDRVFSNTSKNYFKNLINYSSVLKNRNTLLKNKKSRKEVEIWDEPLVKYGCMLWEKKILLQSKFKDSIKNVCKNYNKSVDVMVDYEHPSNPSTEWFYENLREKNDKEFLLGRTLTGPHLDKHTPYFNSKNLKMFGSQGEHKLAFVVIKIAEHYFIEKETGKKPTLLLDDLFSKLDLERGNAIFDLIKTSGQAFITNTDLVTAEQHGIDTKDTNNKTIHLVRNWKN